MHIRVFIYKWVPTCDMGKFATKSINCIIFLKTNSLCGFIGNILIMCVIPNNLLVKSLQKNAFFNQNREKLRFTM